MDVEGFRMFELIIGTIVGACIFIIPLWAYRKGLKDGLAIKQDKPIEPIKTPVQVVQQVQQERKEQQEADKFMRGLQNLLSYDGTPQKGDDEDD